MNNTKNNRFLKYFQEIEVFTRALVQPARAAIQETLDSKISSVCGNIAGVLMFSHLTVSNHLKLQGLYRVRYSNLPHVITKLLKMKKNFKLLTKLIYKINKIAETANQFYYVKFNMICLSA